MLMCNIHIVHLSVTEQVMIAKFAIIQYLYLINRFLYSIMLNYFTGFGASTNFEKNRLIATSKTLEPPQQNILKKILKTFEGEDEETRSQIAFATIIKKIMTSDSNDSWIYLVKNLIILDRVLEDMCFIQEISELGLPIVEGFVQRNGQYLGLKTDQVVRNYWKLIKETAKLLKTKKHILYFPRSQRSQFLETLGTKQLLKQLQSLQQCFKTCFSLISSLQSTESLQPAVAKALKTLNQSKLYGFIKLQLLYKLIGYYSSQMLCTNRFVSLLAKDNNMDLIQLESIREFKQILLRFKTNSNLVIQFVQRNKEAKGFEVINYRDFDPIPGNNLIKSIDKCISQRMKFDDNTQNVQSYISSTPLKLQLRPKIGSNQPVQTFMQPRKKIELSRPSRQTSNTPFSNYKSNFSEDFPQKQVMTIDLIMAIKKEKEENSERVSNYDDIIAYNQRQTCVIPNSQELPDHLMFRKPVHVELGAKVGNLYSGLEPIWNMD